jgi:hypothetical protein
MPVMDMNWTDADKAFADEVRAFLDAELTPDLREAGRWMTSVYGDHERSMAWQAKLHARGWAAPAWPKQHGGTEWSVTQRYIFARERVRAGAPPVSPMGISMCGPALIGHGSAAQKAHFLPRMLSAVSISGVRAIQSRTPGSDLAPAGHEAPCATAMISSAHGTKIWTTHANVANWIFCLVRTVNAWRARSRASPFILIPMDTPGITVQTDHHDLWRTHIQNQIFFDNVRVPAANVVGAVDDGWTVAKYLLEFERVVAAPMPPNCRCGWSGCANWRAIWRTNPSFAARLGCSQDPARCARNLRVSGDGKRRFKRWAARPFGFDHEDHGHRTEPAYLGTRAGCSRPLWPCLPAASRNERRTQSALRIKSGLGFRAAGSGDCAAQIYE